jgi:hypothetical protein
MGGNLGPHAAGAADGAWLKRALGNVEEHTRSADSKKVAASLRLLLCALLSIINFSSLSPRPWAAILRFAVKEQISVVDIASSSCVRRVVSETADS